MHLFSLQMSLASGRKYGGISCCVVGCHNSQYRDEQRGVHFYRFPLNDEKRFHAWRVAVNRKNPKGELWSPGIGARVCSEHFLEGEPSDDKLSPSYVPSIFPHGSKVKTSSSDRYLRHKKRDAGENNMRDQISVQEDTSQFQLFCSHDEENEKSSFNDLKVVHKYVQVNEPFQTLAEASFIICDAPNSNEKCTQATIEHKSSTSVQTKINTYSSFTQTNISSCDKSTNVSLSYLPILKFDDRKFSAFTGISRNFFQFLCFKAGDRICDSLAATKENKILLFLVKLKLHVSFDVLAGMFNVSQWFARQTFIECLDVFSQIGYEYVIWFDKATVMARAPPAFKDRFKNCRVIIDCSEIPTERPATQEQRILLYSSYKSRHTVKFLVGIAPSGEITYISKAFGGRTTDTELTNRCGILSLLEPGDQVLADKVSILIFFIKENYLKYIYTAGFPQYRGFKEWSRFSDASFSIGS